MAIRNGYGVVGIRIPDGWLTKDVHRAVREVIEGESGLNVLHRCGNKPCFNPEHTYYGTQADNARDMFSMGESSGYGEAHYRSKLSTRDVMEIRELYLTSGMTQAQVGEVYGVRQSTVSDIMRGKARVRG